MRRQLEKVERRISKNGHYEVLFSSIEKSTGRCETDGLPASAPPVTCLQSDTSVIRSASPEAGFLSFPVLAIKYSGSFPKIQGAEPHRLRVHLLESRCGAEQSAVLSFFPALPSSVL